MTYGAIPGVARPVSRLVMGVDNQSSMPHAAVLFDDYFTNGGTTFTSLFDDQENASMGDLVVAPSDPNILYLGTGEGNPRNSASIGNGVYKSLDAGHTWKHVGLPDPRQIGRVRVHPRDPDLVYVAALGHTFGPNRERGVFRSPDGGQTWKTVLLVNDSTGAVDLCFDPRNPRTLYATTWQVDRTPWSLMSGGSGVELAAPLYAQGPAAPDLRRMQRLGSESGQPGQPAERISSLPGLLEGQG